MSPSGVGILLDLFGVVLLAVVASEPNVDDTGYLSLEYGWLKKWLMRPGQQPEIPLRRVNQIVRWVGRMGWALLVLGFGLQLVAAEGWL